MNDENHFVAASFFAVHAHTFFPINWRNAAII